MTTKGELYGCGMNDQGQLGEDVFDDLSALEKAKKGSPMWVRMEEAARAMSARSMGIA